MRPLSVCSDLRDRETCCRSCTANTRIKTRILYALALRLSVECRQRPPNASWCRTSPREETQRGIVFIDDIDTVCGPSRRPSCSAAAWRGPPCAFGPVTKLNVIILGERKADHVSAADRKTPAPGVHLDRRDGRSLCAARRSHRPGRGHQATGHQDPLHAEELLVGARGIKIIIEELMLDIS